MHGVQGIERDVAWCLPYIVSNTVMKPFGKHSTNIDHFLDWYNYHSRLGLAQVYAFTDSRWEDPRLRELTKTLNFELVQSDLPDPLEDFYKNQRDLIRKCLTLATKHEWVIFGDFDEYLSWQNESIHTIYDLLTTHSADNPACVTFGKRFFTNQVTHMSHPGPFSRLERPIHPYCYGHDNDMCPSYNGRRKYALKPVLVTDRNTLEIHDCGGLKTTNVRIADARFNEWWGYARSNYGEKNGDHNGLIFWPEGFRNTRELSIDTELIEFLKRIKLIP